MTKSAWAGLILVFALGAAVRLGWVLVHHGPAPAALAYPDEEAYQLAGRSLASGGGLIDEFGYRATYMPAYPAFIAGLERAGASMLTLRRVQALLAALVAPFTFLLAYEWVQAVGHAVAPRAGGQDPQTAPGRAAWLVAVPAGAAAACDPFLIFFSGLLLTEALYAVALVATWWLLVRLVSSPSCGSMASAIATGAGLLACVMLRPSSVILLPVAAAMVVLWGRCSRQAMRSAGLVLMVVIAGLFPWAARNHTLLGEWRWTTTRGGISLYDGLQAGAGGASDLAHTKQEPKAAGLNELQWDQYWRDRAMQSLREDPGRVIALAGRKFLRTWNIIPNEPGHRQGAAAWVSAFWMTAALATAALGLWQVRRAVRWWMLLLAPVAAFTLLHMIFVGSVRYRIPLMPLLLVLSAVGLARLVTARGRIESSGLLPHRSDGRKEEARA